MIDDDFDNYAPWQQRAKREKRAAVRQQNGHERARTSMAPDKSGSKQKQPRSAGRWGKQEGERVEEGGNEVKTHGKRRRRSVTANGHARDTRGVATNERCDKRAGDIW